MTTNAVGRVLSVMYFDQHSGAAPLNAGQNQSKMLQNAGISLKFIGIL